MTAGRFFRMWAIGTNVAFPILAILGARQLHGMIPTGLLRPGGLEGWTPTTWTFEVLMTLLGLASALYHARLVKWGNHADVAAMYAVLGALFGYAMGGGPFVMVGAAVFYAGVLRFRTLSSRMEPKIGALGAAVLLATIWSGPDWFFLVMAGLAFAVAFLARFYPGDDDDAREFLHGVWHLFAAAGLVLTFLAIPPP